MHDHIARSRNRIAEAIDSPLDKLNIAFARKQ
jgi:hypothetical protein